ncbi:hypothetical protein ACHAWF_012446 [Thalassiosira exigua]
MTSLHTSIKLFNVCGRHFEVSRDLIEQQPDSMLEKAASETWHPDPEKAILIDRSGDIFAQAMEYLRYGSASSSQRACPKRCSSAISINTARF